MKTTSLYSTLAFTFASVATSKQNYIVAAFVPAHIHSDVTRFDVTPHHSYPPHHRLRRVKKLLESSGKVALGGRSIAKDLFIEPTVLTDVKPDDPVMQEEIFGPLLPIVTVQSAAEAISFINSR